MATMKTEKKVSRRDFLLRSAAFAAGCASAATGLYTLWKGKRVEPFLSRDSDAVLKRFGPGQDLLDELKLSPAQQALMARRVKKLKGDFDARQGLFRHEDFTRILREAVERDFAFNEVIAVGSWLLSKTEVGIYLFNQLQRSGRAL
jgi:hypothetical protein